MTDEHKAALTEGRQQGRAVRRYLEALEARRPGRPRRSPGSIARRLTAIDAELATAEPLAGIHLRQERIDLERELAVTGTAVDLDALEAAFVAAAGPYSRRKGISYDAWRAVGVAPRVLKAAGIGRR